jgi:hypothetical protein
VGHPHVEFPLEDLIGWVFEGQELYKRMETTIIFVVYDFCLESNDGGFYDKPGFND